MGDRYSFIKSEIRLKSDASLEALKDAIIAGAKAQRDEWTKRRKRYPEESEFDAANDIYSDWTLTIDDNGVDLYMRSYTSWLRTELLDVIAPFLAPGSYVELERESGYVVRIVFDGKTWDWLSPKSVIIVWEMPYGEVTEDFTERWG